ncbi:MAG: hypothetical protein KAH38_00710, partial [Candidatus Hydrogenedentes bacterium]|nr:hypothetical protein [Candidatus Hydrogenedentota bacterium]
GMDKYLTGEEHAFWREEYDVVTDFDPDEEPLDAPRAKMKLIPADRRVHNFNEVEVAFTESVAVREARRCLRCDYCAETTDETAGR